MDRALPSARAASPSDLSPASGSSQSGIANAKHTPGPWLYRPDQYDDWGVVRSAPDEEGRKWVICQARTPYASDAELAYHRVAKTDPWEADARLIAAAPELLDRLENLVIGIGMGWDLDGLIETSRAAIAKARGEA